MCSDLIALRMAGAEQKVGEVQTVLPEAAAAVKGGTYAARAVGKVRYQVAVRWDSERADVLLSRFFFLPFLCVQPLARLHAHFFAEQREGARHNAWLPRVSYMAVDAAMMALLGPIVTTRGIPGKYLQELTDRINITCMQKLLKRLECPAEDGRRHTSG